MSNVRYKGETGRTPSPSIFGDLGKLFDDAHAGRCVYLFDDFIQHRIHANAQASGGYYTYQDTGVLISSLTGPADLDDAIGVFRISGNDADNDEGHIQFTSEVFNCDNATGNTAKILFETRIKKSTVADNGVAFFAGLINGPVAADHLIDDTGVLGDFAAIGFRLLQDNGEELDTVYKAAGQTQAEVQANCATIVANTWVNLGFAYRPAADDNNKITFYVNGAPQTTKVTKTNMDAATFPEGEELHFLAGIKNSSGAANTLDIDWVRIAQYYGG